MRCSEYCSVCESVKTGTLLQKSVVKLVCVRYSQFICECRSVLQ